MLLTTGVHQQLCEHRHDNAQHVASCELRVRSNAQTGNVRTNIAANGTNTEAMLAILAQRSHQMANVKATGISG